jgi:predicted O-methyltransferase YrrM
METIPFIKEDRHWLLRQLPKNSVGAEIGTFVGNFAHYILHLVEPKVLHLVDMWNWSETRKAAWRSYQLKEACQLRFAKQLKHGQVVMHHNLSIRACKEFENESLDWVYIDAGHTYELCYEDLTNWQHKVKPGGVLFGDDYDLPGVNKAFTQWRNETKNQFDWLYLTDKTNDKSMTRNFYLVKKG